MEELMLDTTIEWNGNEHVIKVSPSGKTIITVSSIFPQKKLAELDYSSLDYLRIKLKDKFTLAHKFIGNNGEQYVDEIETKIFE